MLIGVISDTHDRLPLIDKALEAFRRRNVEALIHAGDFVAPFAVKPLLAFDKPIHCTYGNNDGERVGLKALLPNVVDGPLFVGLGGRTILVHHFVDWCSPADVGKADIVITGHTHEVSIEQRDGKLFLNPGECCGWVTGRCSVVVLDTDGPSVEVIELNPHERA